jgi:hypothetical protein
MLVVCLSLVLSPQSLASSRYILACAKRGIDMRFSVGISSPLILRRRHRGFARRLLRARVHASRRYEKDFKTLALVMTQVQLQARFRVGIVARNHLRSNRPCYFFPTVTLCSRRLCLHSLCPPVLGWKGTGVGQHIEK